MNAKVIPFDSGKSKVIENRVKVLADGSRVHIIGVVEKVDSRVIVTYSALPDRVWQIIPNKGMSVCFNFGVMVIEPENREVSEQGFGFAYNADITHGENAFKSDISDVAYYLLSFLEAPKETQFNEVSAHDDTGEHTIFGKYWNDHYAEVM